MPVRMLLPAPNRGDLAESRQCWRRRAAGSWAAVVAAARGPRSPTRTRSWIRQPGARISRAEVAETIYTALSSKKNARRVTGMLAQPGIPPEAAACAWAPVRHAPPGSRRMHTAAASMTVMASVKGRSHRASGGPTRLLQGRVSPETHEAARAAADQDGMSIASYLEHLVLEDARRRQTTPRPALCQEAIAI